MNRRRPLWVTGVGLVTPLGADVDATWDRLVRGERAMAPARLFGTAGQRTNLAAEVEGVVVPAGGGWSRSAVLALTAAREALRHAGLEGRPGRLGLVVGGTTSGMFETETLLARLDAEGAAGGAPLETLRAHPPSSVGDCLEQVLGPFVRVRTLSSACSSGANAVIVAAAWLLRGEVDAVLAGGSDGLCRLTLSGFNALSALDPGPCRPFDRDRRGTNLGEGAGFLVLERAERARHRARGPVAELAGWALGSEAHHITNPAADGVVAARLLTTALSRAGLVPQQVDYVNAHGTGTPANDAMEAAALTLALGDEVHRVPVSSSKAQIGHTLGAAGAIEAVFTALSVARQTVPPGVGLEAPDPALDLVHVGAAGREGRVRAAISSAFGFGGMGSVLVLSEADVAEAEATVPDAGGPPLHAAIVTGVAALGAFGLLGAAGLASLPEATGGGGGEVDPDAYLDAARARRLDRTARLGAAAVAHALAEAGAPAEDSGVVLGTAFGNVDACAAFLRRVLEAGPRAASPAIFPNLVPSSPVGHVSIYCGMQGPAFATSDLGASGAAAFLQAVDLVTAGEAPRIVAGSAEPKSAIVDAVLGPLFALPGAARRGPGADLAAVLVVEAAGAALARGARVMARVAQAIEWRGDPRAALDRLRPPSATRVEIVTPWADPARAALASTAWRDRPLLPWPASLAGGDALDAAALAIAAARVASGRADEAIVVTLAPGRGSAIVLAAP
jgi:3-oxoacyl-[acyl-carrier-protein] synthase II